MKNIHESVSTLLSSKLTKHKSEKLNSTTCIAIYQDIFETFVDVFQESNVNISNEGLNIISQLYYDAVAINGNQELDPNIFTQRASVKNIETKELALLASMFSQTPFAVPFISEIKKRS